MPSTLTERLQAFMQGDRTVAVPLLDEILPILREIAARELRKERNIAPLSRTELINELWIASLSKGGWQLKDRRHFFALASLAMRRVLVDLARRRLAERRGGGESVSSLEGSAGIQQALERDAQQIVEIGLLMDKLDESDPDAARAVEMNYFSGFSVAEIADSTGLTARQVRIRLRRGLKSLRKQLETKQKAAAQL